MAALGAGRGGRTPEPVLSGSGLHLCIAKLGHELPVGRWYRQAKKLVRREPRHLLAQEANGLPLHDFRVVKEDQHGPAWLAVPREGAGTEDANGNTKLLPQFPAESLFGQFPIFDTTARKLPEPAEVRAR